MEGPPLLNRKRTVELPELRNASLTPHPVLCLPRGDSSPRITYNFAHPPGRARLDLCRLLTLPISNTPATSPAIEGQMEILWSGLGRVIVSGNTNQPITVRDVVVAVYRAARSEAIRQTGNFHLAEYQRFLKDSRYEQLSPEQYEREVIATISRYFRGRTHWVGLSRGQAGLDEWILETE